MLNKTFQELGRIFRIYKNNGDIAKMGKTWLGLILLLMDPNHKKPNIKRHIMITPDKKLEDLDSELSDIQYLLKMEGYVIYDMVIVSG